MDFCITHNLHSSFVQMTSLDAIVDVMRNSERLKEAGEVFRRKVGDKARKKVKASGAYKVACKNGRQEETDWLKSKR